MGVTGLWRLIEPAGKPVPVESLENKVLAVDISIWLHQVVKGYQDAKGAPLPNAHLMGLFQRLCKLLYFRIKPVFVFDGGFPELKKETIAKRQDSKSKYNSESERLKREIALLLGKKTAIGSLLGQKISPKKSTSTPVENDDIFKLPALPQREEESESESEEESNSSASTIDLHSVDMESEDFKNMPVKDKYDLLIELKETRKMNSWGKLHTLPKKSDNFSDFQMQRLLKRRKVQECLQETEKEMGDTGMSLNDLESLLNEEGIDTKMENLPTRRIASDNTTRYLLINNVQNAIAEAKKREESSKASEIQNKMEKVENIKDELGDDIEKAITVSLDCESKLCNKEESNKKDELEEDLEKAIKMSLECIEEPNTSTCTSKTDDSWSTYKSDIDVADTGSDSEDGDGYEQPDFSTAKAYIMQYSDFTHKAIDNIVSSKNKELKSKTKCPNVDEIIEELNNERSIIVDKVVLSSDDEEIENVNTKKSLNISEDGDELKNSDVERETCKDNNLNMNLTQSSVIIVDTHEKVIYPDASSKNITEHKKEMKDTKDSVNTEEHDSSSDRNGNELKSSDVKSVTCENNNVDMDVTQSSVVIVDTHEKVIDLDSSSEDITEHKQDTKYTKVSVCAEMHDSSSDTSDGEFEEVVDVELKTIKPVVQVTLTMDETLEDDIFADVFCYNMPEKKETCPTKSIEKNTRTNNIIESKSAQTLLENTTTSSNNVQSQLDKSSKESAENTKEYQANLETNTQEESTKDSSEIPVKEDNQPIESVKNIISTETLNSMVAEINDKEETLIQEQGRMERIGRNITEQMTKEAQELLQVFGIPYIVAPMEAEAQCAFLESANLTDGTITDDSDIWLFGGKTVYKNFFNQKKHVLQFLSERIEKSFNLSREQLILLALLVGSDYTTGVAGVGPVTALEILASFPFNKKQLSKENSKLGQYQQIIAGLQEFKTWVKAGRRTDNISLKKKLRNVTLGDDFPSVRVVQAYLEPNVEKSEEKFTWGEINITVLRDYAKAKFGWSQNKLDVIVQPVLKRMLERKTQKTVHDYFKRKIEFQSLEDQMSKRVKAAVQKMDPENKNLETDARGDFVQSEQSEPKAGKKRKVRSRKQEATTSNTKPVCKKKKIVQVKKVCTSGDGGIEINVPKIDRYQEIIPQREKDMQNILQNKLKAIEVFRKTKIDRKRKPVKKRPNLPKDKAELSESSDSS